MSGLTDATIKLYTLGGIEFDSVTSTSNTYVVPDIPKGDYYYEITKAGKGTIIDFIEIPEDYTPTEASALLKTLELNMYDASPETTILVTNRADETIEGLKVKVANILLTEDSVGTHISSVIPQTDCFVEVNTTTGSYEKYKNKFTFPIADNELTVSLFSPFSIKFNFVEDGFAIPGSVLNLKVKYKYNNGEFSDIIDVNNTTKTIPSTIAHQGVIRIHSVTLPANVSLVNANADYTVGQAGTQQVNVSCVTSGGGLS
jgi:hypothetical protein